MSWKQAIPATAIPSEGWGPYAQEELSGKVVRHGETNRTFSMSGSVMTEPSFAAPDVWTPAFAGDQICAGDQVGAAS